MPDREAIVRQLRGALEREPRVDVHRHPLRIDVAGDAVVLEGEVPGIAAKKLALELAGAVPGIRGVVDRLRVAPAERRGDGAIADSLRRALVATPELSNCTLRVRARGRLDTVHDAGPQASGEVEAVVADGVIALEGSVLSLSHKRLAGVLAWWTPGCRDVLNSLVVTPPEEDTDDEVVDALRLVLEIDPLVRGEQVTASCRDYVVTLAGCVRTDEERRRVEDDAWALFAVDRVVNRIEVRA